MLISLVYLAPGAGPLGVGSIRQPSSGQAAAARRAAVPRLVISHTWSDAGCAVRPTSGRAVSLAEVAAEPTLSAQECEDQTA